MNPLSYGGTPVNIFFCICSISSSHLISLLLSLSRPVWLDIGIKIAQMFPKAVPKANHIIIIFLTWFFQIAQKSRNILAAFERKFVIQNFWKIAQSGRTAQDQSLSLSLSIYLSIYLSLSRCEVIWLILFRSIFGPLWCLNSRILIWPEKCRWQNNEWECETQNQSASDF